MLLYFYPTKIHREILYILDLDLCSQRATTSCLSPVCVNRASWLCLMCVCVACPLFRHSWRIGGHGQVCFAECWLTDLLFIGSHLTPFAHTFCSIVFGDCCKLSACQVVKRQLQMNYYVALYAVCVNKHLSTDKCVVSMYNMSIRSPSLDSASSKWRFRFRDLGVFTHSLQTL